MFYSITVSFVISVIVLTLLLLTIRGKSKVDKLPPFYQFNSVTFIRFITLLLILKWLVQAQLEKNIFTELATLRARASPKLENRLGGETIDNFLKFVQRARIKHSSICSYIIPHTDLHEQLECILWINCRYITIIYQESQNIKSLQSDIIVIKMNKKFLLQKLARRVAMFNMYCRLWIKNHDDNRTYYSTNVTYL